jgi:peptidyl-prolyl cis-trans isomerase B (cyclophilin B)
LTLPALSAIFAEPALELADTRKRFEINSLHTNNLEASLTTMLTLQTLKNGKTALAVAAAILISCSSAQSERQPNANTPEKMDAAVAENISANSSSSATDADSGAVVTEEKKSMTESTESKKSEYEVAVRSEKNHIVKLETNHGDLIIELWRDVAPNHADSFFARVEEGFYDGLIFHRVIPGFMIQGGDPTGTGMGSPDKPGYTLDSEFSDEPHMRGILSMARRGSGPAGDPQGFNTASCQFFICHADARMLDKQYTVFGNLLSGYATLDAIATTKRGAQDRPVEDCVIKKASVIK